VKPVRLGISLGAAIPAGRFGYAVKTGYDVTGSVILQPSAMPIGFRIDAAFNQFGIKPARGNENYVNLSGNALVNVIRRPAIAAYLIGGVGWYKEYLSGTVNNRSWEYRPGFNAGGGIRIPVRGYDTFVEARYHRVYQYLGATSFVPVTFGVLF
jgi:hypothetical protein